jgi:putative membrane protein
MLAHLLPHDAGNRLLLVGFYVLWVVSCIQLPYPEYFAMQHVPTVCAVIALTIFERRQLLDRTGFMLVIAFLLLHLLGARYLYSFVPYDDWCARVFGFRLSDRFGFERNHYDRFVHFSFGLLLVYPLAGFFQRQLRITAPWAVVVAVSFVLAAGAVYEIAERLTAVTFAADWADAYNGQQGDAWDSQKDMALAAAGSLVAAAFTLVARAHHFEMSDSTKRAGASPPP